MVKELVEVLVQIMVSYRVVMMFALDYVQFV